MNKELQNRMESSRKELLDLGLRNPLINYSKRAKQIKIFNERSAQIYSILVEDGLKMTFEPLSDDKISKLSEKDIDFEKNGTDIEIEDHLTQPDEDGTLPSRHTDTKLQSYLSSDKLQTRLLSIHNDARTFLEEQGVNILYIALGFLYWKESDNNNEHRRSPLILIPVEIERTNAHQRFNIAYSGEDIVDNL